MKKFKTAKDFLKTCSKDEQNYVYQSYWDMINYDMIDMIYKHFPASVFIKQVKQYRKANKKSNKLNRKCDCDFVGCQGC
jgi:hypothetical protein